MPIGIYILEETVFRSKWLINIWKGNAGLSHNEITLHTLSMTKMKKPAITWGSGAVSTGNGTWHNRFGQLFDSIY